MEGVRIAAAARRVELIEELANEVSAAGGETITPLKVDLYQPESGEELARAATAALGRIDILMNVAGGTRPTGVDAPKKLWEEVLLLNVVRPRELTHAVLPGMRAQRWGRIISFTGSSEPDKLHASNSAKAAMHAWAKGLSREVAREGITVNSVQPGRIHSEQVSRFFPTPESEREFAEREIPIGRFGEPEEIARVAVFLASSVASYITGAIIPVDGGMRHFAF